MSTPQLSDRELEVMRLIVLRAVLKQEFELQEKPNKRQSKILIGNICMNRKGQHRFVYAFKSERIALRDNLLV